MSNSKADHSVSRDQRTRVRGIGTKLRQMYDEVTQEEVPAEFLKLLEDADDKRQSDNNT